MNCYLNSLIQHLQCKRFKLCKSNIRVILEAKEIGRGRLIKVTEEEILRLKTKLPPIQEALAKFNNRAQRDCGGCEADSYNPLIREFVREGLEKASEGFWLDSCSSSPKYHPPFDQVTPGGIVNHILVATCFVEEGIRRYPEFTTEEFQPDHHWAVIKPDPRWLDLARAATMLHDIAKCGIPWGERTVTNHGHLGAEFLESLESFQKLDLGDQRLILDGVKWHMGRWEEGFGQERGGEHCLFPSTCFTGFELLIQEADYYSTRTQVRVAGFNLINSSCAR